MSDEWIDPGLELRKLRKLLEQRLPVPPLPEDERDDVGVLERAASRLERALGDPVPRFDAARAGRVLDKLNKVRKKIRRFK